MLSQSLPTVRDAESWFVREQMLTQTMPTTREADGLFVRRQMLSCSLPPAQIFFSHYPFYGVWGETP